ncbi:MAG: cysteine--tRNA ligase [Alphaproteobacteria bacterium]|nr:cysteine--tRNA ligase [Alphaproteobacteria bacterium]
MTLTLFDTKARAKRAFAPGDPSRVTMYVCGPTVYDHAHIGNFRAAVVFDLLFRVLRRTYGADAVVYARNFTDIDDKIIAAAAKSREPIADLTARYADIYKAETGALNVLAPTLEPRATAHLADMISLIGRLLETGAAYAAEGHVLFSVAAFGDYGALSGADQEEMRAGARVEVAPYKRDAADFVLWKPSKPGEPGWETPAEWGLSGPGRPGWHLECSAMISRNLGETIDIHGGGQDLRFPHHENELAQSICANGAPLARYWVHNGFLRMGSGKMSKSEGNVVLPRDLLKVWPGEALRWALLSAHYRQPLDWTTDLIEQSKRQLDRFYRVLAANPDVPAGDPPHGVIEALEDDLNTPAAFAALHEARDAALNADGAARDAKIAELRGAGDLLGVFQHPADAWFRSAESAEGPSASEIEARLAERAEARKARDFARSDTIRDELAAAGVVIEDGPTGATWRRE